MVYKHSGVYAAPVMPMLRDLTPDIPRYLSYCRRLFDAGCHGLMPLGTSGEAHSFTANEKIKVIEALAGSGLPVEKMVVGTSSLAYPDAVTVSRIATEAGFGSVIIQSPFYYPVDDDSLLNFYDTLVKGVGSSKFKFMIYDYKAWLGIDHSLEFYKRLNDDFSDNFVGIKDANGNVDALEETARQFPDKAIFEAHDHLFLESTTRGAAGVMSGGTNIFLKDLIKIHELWETNPQKAAQSQKRILAYVECLKGYARVPALKSIVAWQAKEDLASWSQVRPPLLALTESEQQSLHAKVQKAGLVADPQSTPLEETSLA